MRILRSDVDLEQFFERVSKNPRRALLLDYDGTLAPFQTDPATAKPYPGLTELVESIAQGKTRLVIITGRAISDFLSLMPFNQPLEIWGSHGGERQTLDGQRHSVLKDEPSLPAQLQLLAPLERSLKALGARMEKKPFSLAIHYRDLPAGQIAAIRAILKEHGYPLLRDSGLVWMDFDGGLEVRPLGINKAIAIETILEEMGLDASVAFLGDDLTDEYGFQVIRGKGLGVLVRRELRPSSADVWIQPPDELKNFLARWLDEQEKSIH